MVRFSRLANVVFLVSATGIYGNSFARDGSVPGPDSLSPPPVLSGLMLQSSDQNMERTLLIRRAFQEDKVLGPHHIGVRYKDGIVTLWGPVERRELIELARSKALSQRGVEKVRSELYLGRTGNRPTGVPLTMLPPEETVRVQAASPNPLTGNLPAHTPREEKPDLRRLEPAKVSSITPTNLKPPGAQTTSGGDTEVKPPVFVPLSLAVPNNPQPLSEVSQNGAQRPGSLNGNFATDLSEELSRIRASQPRFAGIRWVRRGNHISVLVSQADLRMASDFSQLARQIRGVESVTVHIDTK